MAYCFNLDLQFTRPNVSALINISGSDELLATSRNSVFLINFIIIVMVQPVLRLCILSIADQNISSMNDISIFMGICSSGFRCTSLTGRKWMDLFRNVNLNP